MMSVLIRVAVPLLALALPYGFWRYIKTGHSWPGRKDRLLVVTYIGSRLGLWLIFAIYLQHNVTSSDPRLFYTPILEHFSAGEVPIRQFYYPYGPLLFPAMLPFYLLLGRNLAGISLFAIFAEAVALTFLLKSTFLLERRGNIAHTWVSEALAVYLLNPATLYWTVFHGYHSIVQTTYAMGALYCLLRGRYTIGYAVGLLGLPGSKILAVLDWPALLAVSRPRFAKLLLGAMPLLLLYLVFQIITGNVVSSVTSAMFLVSAGPRNFYPFSEGNVWYLLTLFGDLRGFYSAFPGKFLSFFFFGGFFLLGFVRCLRYLRLGLTSFSFQAAMGITTFTMSLFFLFSFYTGDYYVPMLMLPASLIVTCPTLPRRRAVWSLLLISGFCIAGDLIWTSLGQPYVLVNALSSGSKSERLLAGILTASILVRIVCFAMLAQLGLRVATMQWQDQPFLNGTYAERQKCDGALAAELSSL